MPCFHTLIKNIGGRGCGVRAGLRATDARSEKRCPARKRGALSRSDFHRLPPQRPLPPLPRSITSHERFTRVPTPVGTSLLGSDSCWIQRPNLTAIHPIIRPPTAPDARIGIVAFVMIASGRLNRMPRSNPTTQPGQGSRILQITNPRPKRAINAPSMAARLSGKLRGIISAVSRPPKTSPQRTPREILDIALSSSRSSNRVSVSNASHFSDRIKMSHHRLLSLLDRPMQPCYKPRFAFCVCSPLYVSRGILYAED
jgi:hypothetical protein